MPGKQWDDEDESSSSAASSPKLGAIRRGKFDDEEVGDSDVLESWDADDSEAEREKAKKAAEAKAKAEAEAAANKKPKSQRIANHQADRARRAAEAEEESSDDETEAQKRERLRQTEKEADLRHAQELFGEVDNASSRKATGAASAVAVDPQDPTKTLDLSTIALFNPKTKLQFENLREVLVPILAAHSSKAHYVMFLQEFTKQLSKDLASDQIKKISSTLTTLSNEKMKEEKQADKSGKKSKAQKTKTVLAISRPNVADTNTYEEFGDDDFM